MKKEVVMSSLTLKEIGHRIKTRRKELKFTLQEIADRVGVASSTIQRYESGSIKQLKLPVIESIAKSINVNPVWLIKKEAKQETEISDSEFIDQYHKHIDNDALRLTVNLKDFTFQKVESKKDILMQSFNMLNEIGKDEALKRVAELTEINKYMDAKKSHVLSLVAEDKAEYNFAAHDDGLSPEKAKERIEKAKAIFKQMDEE